VKSDGNIKTFSLGVVDRSPVYSPFWKLFEKAVPRNFKSEWLGQGLERLKAAGADHKGAVLSTTQTSLSKLFHCKSEDPPTLGFEKLSSTIDWRVMDWQSGAKIRDLQLNPPGVEGVMSCYAHLLIESTPLTIKNSRDVPRNVRHQILRVSDDVMVCRWGVAKVRTIEEKWLLALTFYSDFMKGLGIFIRFWLEVQHNIGLRVGTTNNFYSEVKCHLCPFFKGFWLVWVKMVLIGDKGVKTGGQVPPK